MGACYRLSVQWIHEKYKSYRTTCHATNLDHETDAYKVTRSETCCNITFTCVKPGHPAAKIAAGCDFCRVHCTHPVGRTGTLHAPGRSKISDLGALGHGSQIEPACGPLGSAV